MISFFKDEHPLNAFFLTSFTDEGISICVNDEHPLKAYSSILFIGKGIKTCFKDEHLLKTYFLIDLTEGIVICAKDVHF